MSTFSGSPNNAIQSGWATKEDFIRHQTLIGQLYQRQTLAEVMRFMAGHHGFRATFVVADCIDAIRSH